MSQSIDPLLFDLAALGRLTVRLQGVCHGCPNGRRCRRSSTCPVMTAREVLANHLATGLQSADVDGIDATVVPQGGELDRRELDLLRREISSLCAGCATHSDDCFMNAMYLLVERALGVQVPKPAWRKPASWVPSPISSYAVAK